jgi:putative toxin-antitoxin system antitoxin component (TIGR02293 family)
MSEIQDVAAVLGVRRPRTPVDLVVAIEHGLPLKSLVRIAGFLAPEDVAFKYRIVPRASLSRRKTANNLSPSESALVARLASIWASAFKIWQNEETARAFLTRPHQLLDGKRPIDLAIANELGAKLVADLLGRIQSGVAV